MNFESSRVTVSVDFLRQRPLHLLELGLDAFDDRDRVLAGGAPDVEHHRRRAVQPHRLARALGGVLGVADVRDADRRAVHGRDDDVVELLGGVDAAQRAQQDLRLALFDGAARHLDVLGGDGVADLLDRQAVAVQLLDVDDDVDLAGAAAAEVDLADAVDGLDGALHLLVGDLGERAQAHRVRRQDDRHDRIGVGIDLLDDRRQHLRRQVAHRAGDLLADVVGGVVDVALEHEAEGDLARCLR